MTTMIQVILFVYVLASCEHSVSNHLNFGSLQCNWSDACIYSPKYTNKNKTQNTVHITHPHLHTHTSTSTHVGIPTRARAHTHHTHPHLPMHTCTCTHHTHIQIDIYPHPHTEYSRLVFQLSPILKLLPRTLAHQDLLIHCAWQRVHCSMQEVVVEPAVTLEYLSLVATRSALAGAL